MDCKHQVRKLTLAFVRRRVLDQRLRAGNNKRIRCSHVDVEFRLIDYSREAIDPRLLDRQKKITMQVRSLAL